MSKESDHSPLGAEMVAGLSEFCDALESSSPIETRYTVRTVSLELPTKPYNADDVKRVRRTLGASQTVLAKFLGVSVKTIRSWEQGSRPVPAIAGRFLDEIVANPDVWDRRLRRSTNSEASGAIES